MPNPLKLVIFDVDGTLVDSQNIICAAMHNAFTKNRLDCPPRDKLLSIVGLSLPEAFERLGEGRAGFPVPSLVEHYKDAFFALREANAHPEVLYPGARDSVEALAARRDTLLGVATGKSQRGARAVLARHDLSAHFAVIKTADDAPSKPHPGMVLEAMRETGIGAADTVMIGDSIYDMEMARAAGAHAIGVSWGYHAPEALRGAGAHMVVEDFSALVNAIEAFRGSASRLREKSRAGAGS
jgi:phosphoglycolate phosphatase